MSRRLFRSPDDRVLAGVAGGMAETYDMDPALVRVGWALLIIFTGGVFLIIYVIMALVVPLRDEGPPYTEEGVADETTAAGGAAVPPASTWESRRARPRRPGGDNTAPLILGALLVVVGGLFLMRQFIPIDIGQLWPIVVIALGVLLIVSAFGRRQARE